MGYSVNFRPQADINTAKYLVDIKGRRSTYLQATTKRSPASAGIDFKKTRIQVSCSASTLL